MFSFPNFRAMPNFEERSSTSHLSDCSAVTESAPTQQKTPSNETDASQLDFFRLKCEELEKRNRQMEEELRRKSTVEEKLKVIEKKLDKIPTMDMFQKLSSRMTSMEESFKSRCTETNFDSEHVKEWIRSQSFEEARDYESSQQL
jgi:predicted  nucleic acid-binding Zn-ribbon protein